MKHALPAWRVPVSFGTVHQGRFNLNAAMKRLALVDRWAAKRMKALRFHLIGLPGRVVSHARQLIIRLGGGAEALATLLDARQSIWVLAQEPAGSAHTPRCRA